LTPIILVTSANDLAADLLVLGLARRGSEYIRFNQEEFPARITMVWAQSREPQVIMDDTAIGFSEIRSAWFRHANVAPVIQSGGPAEEAFAIQECAAYLAGFWECAPWWWMNKPSTILNASLKLRQLSLAEAYGFRVPRTVATNCPEAACTFVASQESIAKTILSAGYMHDGKRYSIFTTKITADEIDKVTFRQAPVIVQECVPNKVDLRVTVVGNNVFPICIRKPKDVHEVDWRALDPKVIRYEEFGIPREVQSTCVGLVRAHGLTYAALDFIVTPNDEYVFLELNPSGQWGWLEEVTEGRITNAIVDCLIRGSE
jgi:glutathione synthase/RimK-type ligase-like ATP-grasp enzyme